MRLWSQMLSASGVQPDAATSFAPNSLDALSELLWLSDISLQYGNPCLYSHGQLTDNSGGTL